MEVISTNIYDYNELSPQSQEKAYREWEANVFEYPWWDEVNKALKGFSDMFYCNAEIDIQYNYGGTYGTAGFDWESYIYDKFYIEFPLASIEDKAIVRGEWESIISNAKNISQNYSMTGTFTDEIFDGLAEANPNIFDEFEDVDAEFDATVTNFARIIKEDWEYQGSREGFEENDAYNVKYYEDGTVAR